jgi:CheY-like chemotaxis protein
LYLETLILNKIKLDCNILHAKDGNEAVSICRNKKNIQLVLMDLKMPIMNGYEATKLIKEFRPDLPIIAQTAYSTSIERGKAALFGCDNFISKPITEETLSEILNNYLTINKKIN